MHVRYSGSVPCRTQRKRIGVICLGRRSLWERDGRRSKKCRSGKESEIPGAGLSSPRRRPASVHVEIRWSILNPQPHSESDIWKVAPSYSTKEQHVDQRLARSLVVRLEEKQVWSTEAGQFRQILEEPEGVASKPKTWSFGGRS